MKVFFLRVTQVYLQFLRLVSGLEKNDNFEYVINSQHYSFENKTLKNVKIFKFDLNNKFLERIDVENVKMESDKLWQLEMALDKNQ